MSVVAQYSSKGDIVTDALRDMIVSGELAPGTLLRQREIAQQFNVSPTPVREALRRLESEGLVSYDVHRGSRVATLDLAEQEENLRVLAALEPLASSLAAEKITDAELDEIRVLERRIAECAADDPGLKELNRAFHFRIYECARSPLLLSLMRLLWRAFPRGPQDWRPHTESVDQHAQLVAALAARDSARAAEITEEHVLGSIAWMKSKAAARDA
jgi:DNA-binding GntR family transcriptional regulator